MAEPNNHYAFFNKFQTMFYTNIEEFNKFTYFEMKNNSMVLLNNLIKGYPHKANEILDIYSPHVKAIDSPAILIALQRNFVNNFSRPRVPQHVYYKNLRPKAESKRKAKVNVKGLIFPDDVVKELKSILQIDNKTYEYLMFSERIQKLGKQILFEQEKKMEEKITKARKKK